MADLLLSSQQETALPQGVAWDYYFPWNAPRVRSEQRDISSFISFLRYSLHRPRDILTILSILKENFIEQNRSPSAVFFEEDFLSPAFTRKYSDYLLGEIKDQIHFYHSAEDYELFLKFFEYLMGHTRFTYEEFLDAYEAYDQFLGRNVTLKPDFCESPDTFLQFLYDLNVVCFVLDTDSEPFYGFCYRQRGPSNIAPKVRTHAQYDIHFGLRKALWLGKHFD